DSSQGAPGQETYGYAGNVSGAITARLRIGRDEFHRHTGHVRWIARFYGDSRLREQSSGAPAVCRLLEGHLSWQCADSPHVAARGRTARDGVDAGQTRNHPIARDDRRAAASHPPNLAVT